MSHPPPAGPPPAPPSPGCPVCGRPVAAEHRPFCSRRCRDRDLVAWLDGDYRVPAPDGLDSAEADG